MKTGDNEEIKATCACGKEVTKEEHEKMIKELDKVRIGSCACKGRPCPDCGVKDGCGHYGDLGDLCYKCLDETI